MKKTILISMMLLVNIAISAQNVENFVNEQLQKYPEMRLLDIYKSCFQDFMGAEHLVPDVEAVRKYLDQELSQTDLDNLPEWYYEPCGTSGRYVRVNLRVIKENLISEETLLDCFVRSANQQHPSVKKWEKRWHNIIRKIDKMNLNLMCYKEDKQFIDSILGEGKYAISHSENYRNAYHPHYRIVERNIFENEIKPFLSR